MSSLDEKEIKKVVWDIFGVFRGRLDTIRSLDYILSLIFIKYVSDLKCDIDINRVTDNDYILKELLSDIPDDMSFYSIYSGNDRDGIGERINTALHFYDETIFQALYKCDGMIFNDIDFTSERLGSRKDRNVFLNELMHVLSNREFKFTNYNNGTERIRVICSILFEKMASEAGLRVAEFYTPHGVSALLSELVLPKEGDSIYDPACGTGSLLLSAIHKIPYIEKHHNYNLYGQERIKSSWNIAYINMFLHGIYSCQIKLGDVFLNPQFQDSNGALKQFDIVLSNPPFSMPNWGHEEALSDRFGRFKLGVPPQSKADYAFILHMIASMKEDTGRMAVIVPHGVLFRGANEALIRKNLIKENLLDAVIGLPVRLFLSTNIPTAILIFRKKRTDSKILFIDSTNFFENSKGRNFISAEIIDKILEVFHKRNDVDNFSHIASLNEIESNDYNLNITRYIKRTNETQDIDVYSLIDEQQRLQAELYSLEEEMKSFIDY